MKPMKTPLTKRQRAILEFVVKFMEKKGYPPTRAEICEGFEFSSANSAECYLRAIARKGYIKMIPGISRGLVVL